MGSIKDFISSMGNDSWEAIKTIGKFLNYIMHPSLILMGLWKYTVIYSFWVCLVISLVSLILYAIGFKKLGKYVPLSLVAYSFIKMIASAF